MVSKKHANTMTKTQGRSARDDVLVPLFIAQAPQQTLARRGLNPSHWEWAVAHLSRVSMKDASVLDTFISLEQYRQLLLLGKMLFGERELIQWWCADLQLVHTGPLGLAVTAANTVEDSLAILGRYVSVVYPPIQLDIKTHHEHCTLHCSILHAMPDVEDTIMELTVLTLTRILLYLEFPPAQIRIRLRQNQQIDSEYYHQQFGTVPAFNQPTTSISVPASHLPRINKDASPLVFQQALRDCESLRKKLGSLATLARRAYQILLEGARHGSHYSLPAVADKLGMSERTLIRRLKDEDTSFRLLQSDVQLDLAKAQLESSDHSIKRISADAGFRNVSSFSRAFRNRTGLTPSEYRSRHAAQG